jgi:hypothetical protein
MSMISQIIMGFLIGGFSGYILWKISQNREGTKYDALHPSEFIKGGDFITETLSADMMRMRLFHEFRNNEYDGISTTYEYLMRVDGYEEILIKESSYKRKDNKYHSIETLSHEQRIRESYSVDHYEKKVGRIFNKTDEGEEDAIRNFSPEILDEETRELFNQEIKDASNWIPINPEWKITVTNWVRDCENYFAKKGKSWLPLEKHARSPMIRTGDNSP